MCRLFQVGRSSYYDWLAGQESKEQRKRLSQALRVQIREIFLSCRGCYGARRIKHVLLTRGVKISRRHVARQMKEDGLACKAKRRFRITTDSKHQMVRSPNVLSREFKANAPDLKYVGDITYLETAEGWLFGCSD